MDTYYAKGNEIFVRNSFDEEDDDLFLTVHDTISDPQRTVEEQAVVLTKILNGMVVV